MSSSDHMLYDWRGKVIRNYGTGDVQNFTPLGQLQSGAGGQSYTYDANGNRTTHSSGQPVQLFYTAHTDRMWEKLTPNTLDWDTTSYSYSSKGEQISELHTHAYLTNGLGCMFCSDTAKEMRSTSNSFTTGLMTASKYNLDTLPSPGPHYQQYGRKETYRYDAFGRRVWVEIVRDTNCTTHDQLSDCSNFVRRVTWDGDQILRETQVAADTGAFNPTLEGGSVTYVHGGSIDQPLEAYKSSSNIVLPYLNWHGQFVAGTCPLSPSCNGVAFPLSDATAYDDIPGGVAQGTWFGTLIKGQIDASGYEYKRNRYYSPNTGRFTSEDPTSLAGGLNVYGYAKGDPTSFADPIGLCPCSFDDFAMQTGHLLKPAQTPLEIAGYLAITPLTGGMGMMEKALAWVGLGGKAAAAAEAVGNALAPTARVLGHYPEYLQVAEAIGAKVFSIPAKIWNAMSEAAQWTANQTFLDRGISEGAEFVMATARDEIRPNSMLSREVSYLLSNGYKWADDGASLIPK